MCREGKWALFLSENLFRKKARKEQSTPSPEFVVKVWGVMKIWPTACSRGSRHRDAQAGARGRRDESLFMGNASSTPGVELADAEVRRSMESGEQWFP